MGLGAGFAVPCLAERKGHVAVFNHVLDLLPHCSACQHRILIFVREGYLEHTREDE